MDSNNQETYYHSLIKDSDPIEKLNTLALAINDHYYDVGCLLYNLKETDAYKTVDGNAYYSDTHSRWKQFCEDKLTVSYRTAQYWLNVYRYFSELGVSKDKLANIGWSKAKELIDITEDLPTLAVIMDKVEELSIQETRAYIAEYKKTTVTEQEVNKFTRFTFNLPETQGEMIQDIIKAASNLTDGNMNEAFFMIALEWFQTRRLPVQSDEGLEVVDSNDYLDEEPQLLVEV